MCRASPAARPASCSAPCRSSAIGRRPQEFGVKYGGVGLDARLVTDLSMLEPNKLITPNELAYIRTEMPAAAAEAAAKGPWTLEASGLLAQPARHQARRSRDAVEEDGPASVRVLGQRQPVELRVDERRRMGRHSARRRRRAAQAVEGRDRRAGQRLRSHRPEFAALDRRRQLGLPARDRSTSSARSSRSA